MRPLHNVTVHSVYSNIMQKNSSDSLKLQKLLLRGIHEMKTGCLILLKQWWKATQTIQQRL